jgi:uncharacterized integral membrane protein
MEVEPGVAEPPEELEALVVQWTSLQADIRELKRASHRRIMAGIVVLAAVAGYALETATIWLFGFIPVIIGLMFAVHVQESNHVFYRSWQCHRVEEAIAELGVEPFDWTEEFGAIAQAERVIKPGFLRRHLGASLRQSPSFVIYAIGVATYTIFIGYTVGFVVPMEMAGGARSGYPWVAGIVVAALYLLLTAVLLVVSRTHRGIRADFDAEVLSG